MDQDTSAKLKQQGLFELRSPAHIGVQPAQLNLAMAEISKEMALDEG